MILIGRYRKTSTWKGRGERLNSGREKNIINHSVGNFEMFFFLFIPYILPYYITTLIPSVILTVLQLLGAALILVSYYKRRSCRRYTNTIGSLFLFLLILGVATVIKSGDLKRYFLEAVKLSTTVCLCVYLCSINKARFLDRVTKYFCSIVFINDVLMVILQGSIAVGEDLNNQMNFMGRDNYMGSILIPALFLSLYTNYKSGKLTAIKAGWLVFLFLFPIVRVYSAGSIVSCVVALIVLFVLNNYQTKIAKHITYFRMIVGMLIVFVLITIVGASFFSNFAVMYLGKTPTFSGRTYLWRLALEKIANAPILGYGFGSQAFYGIRFDTIGASEYTTCHSSYLLLLLYGGILLFASFISFLLSSNKEIQAAWKHSFGVRILAAGIIGMLVYYIAEWNFDSIPMFWLLTLLEIESVDYLEEHQIKINRRKLRVRL